MKSLLKKGALSARPEATNPISSRIFQTPMLGIVLTVISLLLYACNQSTNGQSAERKQTQVDSLQKPKVDIKVNRRYDEKGNLVGFDSTYTSYYSNMSGDTVHMDSLMGSFDSYFRQEHSSFFGKQFDPLFFNDSTRYQDFFHNDFFMRRYELNDSYMRDMMQRMDSLKNKFYQEHRKIEKKSRT